MKLTITDEHGVATSINELNLEGVLSRMFEGISFNGKIITEFEANGKANCEEKLSGLSNRISQLESVAAPYKLKPNTLRFFYKLYSTPILKEEEQETIDFIFEEANKITKENINKEGGFSLYEQLRPTISYNTVKDIDQSGSERYLLAFVAKDSLEYLIYKDELKKKDNFGFDTLYTKQYSPVSILGIDYIPIISVNPIDYSLRWFTRNPRDLFKLYTVGYNVYETPELFDEFGSNFVTMSTYQEVNEYKSTVVTNEERPYIVLEFDPKSNVLSRDKQLYICVSSDLVSLKEGNDNPIYHSGIEGGTLLVIDPTSTEPVNVYGINYYGYKKVEGDISGTLTYYDYDHKEVVKVIMNPTVFNFDFNKEVSKIIIKIGINPKKLADANR